MVTTDFSGQTYVAEVLRTTRKAADIAASLAPLVTNAWRGEPFDAGELAGLTIFHGFVASDVSYHRASRTITDAAGTRSIPRIKTIRRHNHYLYDLLVICRNHHLMVAVPFHGLATKVFLAADRLLAGTRTYYETLNITNMVIRLASDDVRSSANEDIGVIRCHLAYEDPVERRRDIESIRLTGMQLGRSEIYRKLIEPVLRPRPKQLVVTPVLLGFASFSGGSRRASATTDRHGNFKVWIGPGLRQVGRLFPLLDAIERLEAVVETTSNIPILQSAQIETID